MIRKVSLRSDGPADAVPDAVGVNVSLEVVRGIAAILVVLAHAREFILGALGTPASSLPLVERILLAPTSLGQEAVAIFFVVSGYLVGTQTVKDVRGGRFAWRTFLIKRLSRLWTVLIPGLLLTALIDHLAVRPGTGDAGLTAVCNAAFLQESRCNTFGSNISLWSLSYEFWMYIVFAGGAVVVEAVAARDWQQLIGGVVAVAVTLLAFGFGVLLLMPAWLMGVGIGLLERWLRSSGRPKPLPPAAIGAILLAAAVPLLAGFALSNVVLSDPDASVRPIRTLMVGVAAVPLILGLVLFMPGQHSRALRLLGRTGAVSYSSYVYHAPLLQPLVLAPIALAPGIGVGWRSVACYLAAAVAYAAAIGLWWLTERRTSTVRRTALRVLGPRAQGTR